ncbi:hypothetical protein [Streptacidiphilus neutrinimicus]|uniref:hypothetical protein n=1 Tax=Streptacidiphilus neutrinimicus TaxID=105420 RepID=UPI0005A9E9E4|nr:hypothetical protein [Streptacidiphilus neutrinimicus]
MIRLTPLGAAALLPLLIVAAAPAGSAPRPAGVHTGGLPDWSLVLDDAFDGAALNTAIWRPGLAVAVLTPRLKRGG